MKIGIDAHSITEQHTGVATYVTNLINSLATTHPDAPVTLYVNSPSLTDVKFSTTYIPKRPMWTSFWLPLHFLTHSKPDVMLYPAHVVPFYSPMKTVVTVHDLAFERFPDHFTSYYLFRLKLTTRHAVTRADHVIAVSQATKNDLIELYNVNPEKITMIYHGFNRSHFRLASKSAIEQVKQKYNLNRPYLLAVGTLQKRKNHIGLIEALKILRDNGNDIDLVVSGTKGWLYDEIFERVHELKLEDYVRFIGYADYNDLPALYSGAEAAGLVSLYEGFGLPVLEALACQTPVVVSNNSSLPEVGGDAVITVDPLNHDEIAKAFESILTDTAIKTELLKAAPAQCAKFSWEKTAQETFDLLKKVGHEKK